MIDIENMQAQAQSMAQLLKTMAHPARLMVLCQLSDGEQGVSTLQENSALGQSAFSQHMAVLREHELVSTRKEAQQVFYRLADKRAKVILAALQDICQAQAADDKS